MTPEQLQILRECCRDDATFEQLQQIFLGVETKSKGVSEQIRLQASLLEQVSNAVIATDTEGIIFYWNRFAQKLYQWKAEEVIGKNIYEVIFTSEHRHKAEATLASRLQSEISSEELVVQRKDGSQFVAETTYSLIRDANGITGIVGISVDATRRKQAEEALKQSEAKLKAIFNSSLQSVLLIDREQKIQAYNKTANAWSKKISNKELEEGKLFYEFIALESLADFKDNFNRAIQGEFFSAENYVEAVDGSFYWVEVNYCPVFNDGEIWGICQTFVSIDNIKEKNNEFLKNQQRLRSLVQNSSDLIAILEADGTISYVSPSAERILGYKPKELIGKNALDYIHSSDITTASSRFSDALKQPGVVILGAFRVRHADGFWIYLEAAANNLLNEASTKGVVVNSRDITERKASIEALRQQTEREKLMAAIAHRIRQSLNFEEILNTTVAEVREFLKADRVVIYQFQRDWSGVIVVESVADGWSSVVGMKVRDSWFAANYIEPYQNGAMQVVEDIYKAGLSECHIELLAQFQIRANLVVPILKTEQQGESKTQNQLWGLLLAHQCSEPRQWQQWEIDMLASLGTQVGMAIQQSLLYRQTQQQAQREQALNRFTGTIRSYLDLDTIFATAAKEISQLLQVDRVKIQQHLLSKQVWLTVSEHRKQGGVPSKLDIEVVDDDNEISRTLKQLKVVRINDTNILEDEASRGLAETFGGAWLMVPLHFQGGLWGSLWLMIIGRSYEWEDSEIEFVWAIASQLAMAIGQAQLYEQISALNADLERQVRDRTLELEQKVQELQQLNILKDEFLSTVSHELRTPLTNMKMAMQMLKIAPAGDRRQRYMEILEAECARETELINDLLDLQRLEAAAYPIRLEPVNLQTWLPVLVAPFYSRVQEHQQTLLVDLPESIPAPMADPLSLGRMLAELLNNACKYTASGHQIVLRVAYDEAVAPAPVIKFIVSNQAEIPANLLPRIFEKFYRVPKADRWNQGGTGLGLALVKRFAEQLEGTVQVESSGGWTTFTIQIPATPGEQLKSISKVVLI